MAGGPVLPSSIYLGGASGFLYPSFYIPSTNSNGAGAFEGIGCVASLSSGSTAPAILQFNMPESLPTGSAKLRCLSWANATSGNALFTVKDGHTAAGSNIAAASLSTETQTTITWSSADVIVETKITLSSTIAANDILTARIDFNSTGGWTLAAASVYQFSLVWE